MKKIYILFFALLILILVFILLLGRKTQNNKDDKSTVPTPYIAEKTPGKNDLVIVNILPPQQSPYTKASRNQELQIIFNKPVDASGVVADASPSITLAVRQGNSNSEVYISPTFPKLWEPNQTYLVTISKSTRATDGTPLLNEKKYTLQSFVPIEPLIQER